ncbi:alpha/beta fold hydrolase [Methylobacterium sp. SD21]|uniref:alpha/beta fold hydrolase n=1 Tax=Methylobacterium litchii TaxID=3138810 RepID=UPI00313BF33C
MRALTLLRAAAVGLALSWAASAAQAAEYPAPKEGDWTVKDFTFHTGEVLPELHLHYVTIGDPKGEPVVVLHGTTGSTASMLTDGFAGELFGPGQPLDAAKYYIIIPDAIGHGKSSKPSDRLKTRFPKYNYDDMAEAQYRLLKQHLGLEHVRLIIGNSMGGMHAWILGATHPDYTDILVPMAAQPSEMASRNWMLRRLLVESIRRDPAYANGEYTTQPPSLRVANVFFALATSGGTLALQNKAPTGDAADALVTARLAAPLNADANDYIYQWESSRGYNPSPGLETIKAAVLAINSADDERNPPETGIMERDMKRLKNGRLYLIPASPETTGHGTTAFAKFYKEQLRALLQTAPKLAM